MLRSVLTAVWKERMIVVNLPCGLCDSMYPIDVVNGGAVRELEQLECLAFSIAVQPSFSEVCALHFPLWPGR